MRMRPLRMRRITRPVSRWSKTVTFLKSPTPICLFTVQFYWATTMIKGRLLSSYQILKPFSGENVRVRLMTLFVLVLHLRTAFGFIFLNYFFCKSVCLFLSFCMFYRVRFILYFIVHAAFVRMKLMMMMMMMMMITIIVA